MADHNPIAFEFRILDVRSGIAVHLVEHDHEGRVVDGGINVRLTGGQSVLGELGGGHYFKVEAE